MPARCPRFALPEMYKSSALQSFGFGVVRLNDSRTAKVKNSGQYTEQYSTDSIQTVQQAGLDTVTETVQYRQHTDSTASGIGTVQSQILQWSRHGSRIQNSTVRNGACIALIQYSFSTFSITLAHSSYLQLWVCHRQASQWLPFYYSLFTHYFKLHLQFSRI